MAISVELHSTSGQKIDRQELEKRLIEAGAKPYPENPDYDNSGKFMDSGVDGSIRLRAEENVKNGSWALVWLYWGFDADSWKRLLDIAEDIGARAHDSTFDNYITYEMIDDIVEHYYKRSSSRQRNHMEHRKSDMSEDELTNVLKKIAVAMAEQGDDTLADYFGSALPRNTTSISKEDLAGQWAPWDKNLIEPLLYIKKLLGSPKNPSKMCYEIEQRTTEKLDANPDSWPVPVLDGYIMELLSEKRREEEAESMNTELWRRIEKVKDYTKFDYDYWNEGIKIAVKDYTGKTPTKRRVSIAEEMNKAIDKIVQKIKQQNRE